MRALVLESAVRSVYRDSDTSYEFPTRYLRLFEPLTRGEPMVAVIYEPRGDTSAGRIAYVGWALLEDPPKPADGQAGLYEVRYAGRYLRFDYPVPREVTGEPLEAWLRNKQRGRLRNVATVGRAVREIELEDLAAIFAIGLPRGLSRSVIEAPYDPSRENPSASERMRQLVRAVTLEARFRDDVLQAYSRTCAVTGVSAGDAQSTEFGVVDATRIRPLRGPGADVVTNGIALTPTVRRLFDSGLFTLRYSGPGLTVRTSPALHFGMLSSARGFRLELSDGMPVPLPLDPSLAPSREALRYHQHAVFIARS